MLCLRQHPPIPPPALPRMLSLATSVAVQSDGSLAQRTVQKLPAASALPDTQPPFFVARTGASNLYAAHCGTHFGWPAGNQGLSVDQLIWMCIHLYNVETYRAIATEQNLPAPTSVHHRQRRAMLERRSQYTHECSVRVTACEHHPLSVRPATPGEAAEGNCSTHAP